MIGSVVARLSRLANAKAELGAARARKAGKAPVEKFGVLLEPNLDDLFSEEIIAALMRADGVDPVALKAAIQKQAGFQSLGTFARLQAIAAPRPHLWHVPQQGDGAVSYEDRRAEGGL